ncbi:MAG: family 20 glycosylhydrolase, partial [Cytophagales bacterium]
MKRKSILLVLLAVMQHTMSQNTFKFQDLETTWSVIENNFNNEAKFLHQLTLVNKGKSELPNSGWSIYFNFGRKTLECRGDFKVEHINGDLFKLLPTSKFKGIKPGEKYVFEMVAELWAINNSDAPAGLYGVWDKTPRLAENIQAPKVLPFVNEKQLKRTTDDKLVAISPSLIFSQNKFISLLKDDDIPLIIPRPVDEKRLPGLTDIDGNILIVSDNNLKEQAQYLAQMLSDVLDKKISVSNSNPNNAKSIQLSVDAKISQNPEAYQLKIKDNIQLTGAGIEGLFYAIQSFRALLPVNSFALKQKKISLPNIEVIDEPRFAYRGVHLDVGRNFQSMATVLKFLDLMAFYKLNKFHFHVTEDEGWRIEIPSLPELTEIGSKRGHTIDEKNHLMPSFGSGANPVGSNGSGFYTKDDFVKILRYAKMRNIEVIPEIDIPGHSRAAIVAMKARYERLKDKDPESAKRFMIFDPNDKSEYMSVQMWKDNVMCMCHDAPFNFFETVLADIKKMYDEAGAPLTTIHTGGDEVPNGVWEKSPICIKFMQEGKEIKNLDEIHEYYLERVHKILSKYGLKTAGWEEIALRKTKLNGNITHIPSGKFTNHDFVPYVWNNVWGWGQEDFAYKLANLGYKTVLANATNLYFDLAYNRSPDEPGYYWAGFCDIDKPFAFHPFDYFKSAFEDRMGNAVDKSIFTHKEKLTDFGKSNIIGIQGQLWSENIKGQDLLEYFAMPKLIGLAERAWSPMPSWSEENNEEKFLSAYQQDFN